MVTLHTEALQARKGHVDNMAPRSKPRVKHRSSINSKGLKNKVEPSTVFADRKKHKREHKKGRETSFEVNLSGMPFFKNGCRGKSQQVCSWNGGEVHL